MAYSDSYIAANPTASRPQCRFSAAPVPYEEALSFMEARVADIRNGTADELLWFLEHPHFIRLAPAPAMRICSTLSVFRYLRLGAG